MSELIIEPIEDFALSKSDMPKAAFSQVGIVGCGTTGQRIALMIAKYGIEVIFLELNQEKIDEAYREMEEELDRMIDHWGMTEGEKRGILTRMKGTLDYSGFKDCDLVIDAILSKQREYSKEIRKAVFLNIEKYVSPKCIIATNSTTIVITEFASELEHKDRCVSLHFSTTSPSASIVEVVKGLYATEEVCQNIRIFTKLIDKTPIPVEESPGLVSVRLAVSLISEACDVLMEGVSNKEDIDFTMRNGLRLPLGPFEMADKIGLDKVIRWMDNLYREFGDMKYKAPPILKKLVRAKHLGRKTGQGFYKYDDEGRKKQTIRVENCK